MKINSNKVVLTNCARDTDEAAHGEGTSRANGRTVFGEGGSQSLAGAVLVLNLEFVLEELKAMVLVGFQSRFARRTYNEVTLALLEAHLLNEKRAESVQGVAVGGNLGVGEDTNCFKLAI